MGRVGYTDMEKEAVKNDDSSDSTDTQPIHVERGHDGFQHMENTDPVYDTLPIDDTLPLEYEFETQKIDFEDQAFNLFDETQVLDEFNFEAPANDECEGSDRTEVLSDTQVLSDDDFMRRGGGCLVDHGNTPNSGYKEQSDDDVTSRGEQHPGSMIGGFTCIRAASIRASGLAARNMALERTKSNSCSRRSGNVPQLQISGKDGGSVNKGSFKLDNEFNLKKHHKDYDRQVNEYENVPTVSSTTVRKLFSDDMVSDGGESDGAVNNCGRDDLLNSYAFENVLGGLSYIDSQEPGELSQAHALDVVDKFLELNVIVGNEDVSLKKLSGGKSAVASRARGAQSLAKNTSTVAKHGAFKWDDNFEDEGGGEFFKNKRELLFGDGHGNQKRKKSRYLNSKSSTASEKVRIKENPASKRKLKALVMSDSKLLSENLGRNCKSSDFTKSNKKNLIEDLNEDMRSTSRDGQVGNELDNNLPGVLDVGFDTQLAADAMEELQFGAGLSCNDGTNGNEGTKKVRDELDKGKNVVKNFYRKGACSGARVRTRESKKATNGVECRNKLSNSSAKQSKNANKKLDGQLVGHKPIRAKSGPEDYGRNGKKNISCVLKMAEQRGEDGVDVACVFNKPAETEKISSQKCPMQEQPESPLPITHRTKVPLQMCHVKCGKDLNSSKEFADAAVLRNKERTKAVISATSGDESNFCDVSDKDHNPENASFRELDQFSLRILNYPKKRRTRSQTRWAGQDASTDCNVRSKRSKRDVTSTSQINESSEQHLSAPGAKRKTPANGKSSSGPPKDVSQVKIGKRSKLNTDREGNGTNQDASPKDRCKPSVSASITPVSCATPVNAASPICKGDEYHRQSCRKNLARSALMKEISSLSTSGKDTSPVKDSRRRRDMANVRVLFSHHMDTEVVKQQKKILRRLGASEASSMSDASHFMTDIFVRTKNMLEAIAFGKPVVTHLWLESCGQASCFIDERNYILRDTRKEKEFGFSMPASLARACQHPLLLGQKVLITPNTKPGKEILINLVNAVHGLAVERLGRSSLKDKFPDDLLVLSCEEDYDICLPLLEKGTAVYSSELLLNGIVTQRLEYERHRLFTDKVKKKR